VAKVERVETDVLCDRPGCGKRVTDKGGILFVLDSSIITGPQPTAAVGDDHVDLCRECLQQMQSAWKRKAGDEP
jgi:hypothetical protein